LLLFVAVCNDNQQQQQFQIVDTASAWRKAMSFLPLSRKLLQICNRKSFLCDTLVRGVFEAKLSLYAEGKRYCCCMESKALHLKASNTSNFFFSQLQLQQRSSPIYQVYYIPSQSLTQIRPF